MSGAVFVAALLTVLAAPAWAGPEILREVGHGHAAVLADGVLVSVEGVEGAVRLAAIQIPDPASNQEDEVTPFEIKAYTALNALFENHQVSVHALPVTADRSGRILAYLIRDDGLWIQAELVKAGLVRVVPTTDAAMFADMLLALEQDARVHGRGLWADQRFAVRDPDDSRLKRDTGRFEIVEGKVASVAKRGDNIYVDFGLDYRTDFTVTIPRASMAEFKAAGIDPSDLVNQKVRVHGWITQYHGPEMELTTPAALEVLE
jgi:endonuclease YncB( thermonuclease family)